MRYFLILMLMFFSFDVSAVVVKRFDVSGTKRMDEKAASQMLGVEIGDDINVSDLNAGVERLYKTGLFKDISVDLRGNTVVVKVEENPILNRVTFEGNDEIDDETLRAEVGFQSRQPYSPSKVQSAVDRMLEVYKRSGLFSVQIEPKVIERENNRVDLVFEIEEKDKTYILDIKIDGNKAFSESELKTVILSRETRWWRFFSSFDTYDEDRIEYDKELLRRHYQSNGFIDMKILSFNAGLTPDRKGYFMHIVVDEGERYTFGEITIENPMSDVSNEDLKEDLLLEKGDFYSITATDKTEDKMVERFNNNGYAFVSVKAIPKKNPTTKTVDITFKAAESRKVYINRMEIAGNSRTMDYVIEREFRVKEQDAFNLSKVNRSRQRLMRLGYFKTVDVRTQKVQGVPDRLSLLTTVEEQPTGEMSFALGWSTVNGALINAGITERNFMGRGQTVSLTGTFSQKRTKFEFSFTEPYFLGRELAAGYDIDYTYFAYSDDYGYDMQSYGGALRLGWSYSERLNHNLRFEAHQQEVLNVFSSAPLDIQDEEGDSLVLMLSQTMTYNKSMVDYVNLTRSGYVLSLTLDYAGFGGDESFVRSGFSSRFYHNFWDNAWQFGVSLEAGYLEPINDDYVKRHYRYYLGGDSLRGFDVAGIGARSKFSSTYAYGGLSKANGTAQLNFPVGLPKEYQVSGFIFSDYGWLGEPSYLDSNIYYTGSVRTSAGFGIKWGSPMGEINISWGKAMSYEPFDDLRPFLLSFRSQF
ncbi:MAG: outer membrane protein assembly factor BamA [Alphaproteobacteria bacterium]|nr:outer membrane protein assembly factor BamA [Alphaproteobacteria bacterium]